MKAIITTRYNSTRLPGKALIDICGKNSLQRTVDALKGHEVIVATSDTSPQIIDYCKKNKIEVFSYPNEGDCLTRLYKCTIEYSLKTAIRIWGDSPLINTPLIDSIIKQYKGGILYTEGFPKGWGFYIFDCVDFQNIYERMSPIEKYHWNNSDEISCWHGYSVMKTVSPVLSYENYSLDTLGDLERIEKICRNGIDL